MVTKSRKSVLALSPCGSAISEMSTSPVLAGMRGAVFAQKLPSAFQNRQAHLSFDVVGMHRQFLAGLEVEIEDFEIGRVVHQQLCQSPLSANLPDS